MKRFKPFGLLFLLVLLTGILAGCGGGGGGGGGGGKLQPPATDISGQWRITESTKSINCEGGFPGEEFSYGITVVQSGNSLEVTTPVGPFSGTISGSTISWTDSFPEEGGTTTINSMELTVSSDGTSLSGRSPRTWSDSFTTCFGTTAVSGSFISGRL